MKMKMKKKYLLISSIVLLLVSSITLYKLYKFDNSQQNITFRTDTVQDAQVKNNEMMVAKSLTNIMNPPAENKHVSSENSDGVGLSNNVENNKLK